MFVSYYAQNILLKSINLITQYKHIAHIKIKADIKSKTCNFDRKI